MAIPGQMLVLLPVKVPKSGGVNKSILICGRIIVIMGRSVRLVTSASFLFVVVLVVMAGCLDQPVKNTTPAPEAGQTMKHAAYFPVIRNWS